VSPGCGGADPAGEVVRLRRMTAAATSRRRGADPGGAGLPGRRRAEGGRSRLLGPMRGAEEEGTRHGSRRGAVDPAMEERWRGGTEQHRRCR